ncbi:MAG TPA: efflux RND transporter periplasmic adaptor subunit [Steroidobacteraceae bacterium]|jgi:membrane fusion protein (multidrug efflux system)|nr:efflux RND transporter periplasmic adaptor subunit [Steroidobacteraceae bacterium]
METVAPRALVKPIVIMLIAAVAVLGLVFGWQYIGAQFGKKFMDAAAHAPQTVSTITAATSEWQSFIQSTGTLRAVRGADLSAQASGVVDEIAFDSGNEVPAGKVLLRLKPNDDYAKLQQLQAAAELAEQTYKRDQEQFAAQAISQANIDTDVSTLKSARAQVAAQQALIDEKIVKAPFAGRLGIRQVDIGQYLTAGTAVVTLQALDPILVDFYVPQQALAQLKIGQPISATVDTYPNQAFSGSLEAINSKVDPSSRNVQVRAALHNADRRLIPGMFANVRVQFGEKSNPITLPQTVVTYNPFGDSVFVVGKDGVDEKGKPRATVQQRFVKLGATRGDQVAVLGGIKVGEVIVSAGQMKLRNGTVVSVNNELQPSNSANPNPPNE